MENVSNVLKTRITRLLQCDKQELENSTRQMLKFREDRYREKSPKKAARARAPAAAPVVASKLDLCNQIVRQLPKLKF